MKTLILSLFLFSTFSLLGQNKLFLTKNAKWNTRTSLDSKSKNFTLIKRPNDFRTGLVYSGSIGVSKHHVSLNGNLSYALATGLEFGLGMGFHSNQLNLPINNANDTLSIGGTPLFLTGRYFLANFWDDILKPYVRTRIGYSFATSSTDETYGKGFVFENSLGIELRINWDQYVFIECSQYNQKTKGSMRDDNRNLNVNYNLWFNDILVRFGYTRRLFN